MRRSNTGIIAAVTAVVVILCCLCFLAVVIGGLAIYNFRPNSPSSISTSEIILEPTTSAPLTTPIPGSTQASVEPSVTPQVVRPTASSAAQNTLKTLQQAEVPINSLIDLAERLKGIQNIPVTETPPPAPYQIGATHTFWASNVDDNKNFKVDASLRYITPHLYFWIENGVNYSSSALKNLGDTFEQKIYPTDRSFFGSEWTPGVDDDVHLYILFARGLGNSVAGYYSSPDEYDPLAHPYSNAHEMFFINADNQSLSDSYTFGTLAHEFQHMIHWYRDRNEDTWMNEGFSVLAELLNGYDVGGFDFEYMSNPDLQLTDWSGEPGANGPHYGQSFLYLDYLLNRVGNQVTQDVVGDPQNGLTSIDETLAKDNITDPQTKQTITADDIFSDWVVTNFVQDPKVGDGRYVYKNYSNAPQANETEGYSRCPVDTQTRDVHQYGVDYIRFSCSGQHTLTFTGSTEVGLLAEKPHSGNFMFWSNKGDESDMTLTRSFDLTGKSGPISLEYYTWFDLEKDYDYLYIEGRIKGGQWKILRTPSGTDSNPSGNAYGWGYTGPSNGWVQETVDLSQFAGQQVEVRFEYVTDPAVNGEGFLLDDVSIPQINYQTDFEQDDGGWQAAGFVRIENSLPQTYRVSLILNGKTTSVQKVELNADETASVPFTIGGDVQEVILVVSGTTRFTRQLATYQYSVK